MRTETSLKKKTFKNRGFVAISASCLETSVDLDVVKRKVQKSTICHDLGIVFGSLCRPGRREKEGARIDDLSRFEHRF